ncbi:MAG TPA: metallophosphoesterase [Candidatus Methanoperedens sp.]|nr:metallophosphoesterase [Candidatus Methanoperedens sp.]
MNTPRAQFAVFFLIVTAIYGGVHAYLWWRITRQLALRAGSPAALGIALGFAALVVTPFLGRMLRDGSPLFNAVELFTFIWMGAAFYLFFLNLGADLWNLAAAIGRLVAPPGPLPALGGPRLFVGVAIAAALIVGWAAIDAANVRLRRVTIPTAKLAPGSPALRIVQVSDVHLGMLVGRRRLETILRRVREAQPDLVVATGDILDAVGDHLEPLAAMWRELAPPLGKFAVTGNHEYYSGVARAVAFLEEAGFRTLRDQTAAIPGKANLIGVEYRGPRALTGSAPPVRPLAQLVGAADARLFTLLLKHLPTGFEEETAPLGIDLQLSGHTHDGQLWPFRWLVRLSFRHTAGLVRAGESRLYVSRGTGTWGPPLRFLAPPEVTLIEVVPASHEDPSAALRSSHLPATGTSPSQHLLVARLASGPSCEAGN